MEKFKVGEAPWEKEAPETFKVGQAPWEAEEPKEEAPKLSLAQEMIDSASQDVKNLEESQDKMFKGSIDALPIAGGMFGGILGPAGAGFGAMAGKSVKDTLNKALYNEGPQSRTQQYQELAQEGLGAASGEMAGPILMKGVGAIGTGIKKAASSLSKIPQKVIETYAERAPQIAKISSGSETDLIDAADEIRKEAQKHIENFKSLNNTKITKALDEAKGAPVSVASIKQALMDNISKIDAKVNPEQIARIQKELDLVDELSLGFGQGIDEVPASQAYAIQKRLQDAAEYLQPGQAFKRKDFVDLTFQKAAAKARQELGRVVPEISQANKELSKIRQLDKTMNKNLITPEKPFGSLMSAGTGQNQQSTQQLRKLSNIIGQDLVSPAEDLAAASYFNNAGILPAEKTGSSLAPLALGTIGGITSGFNDLMEGDIGGFARNAGAGVALGSMGSPLAIKSAISAGRMIAPMIPSGTSQMIQQFIQRSTQMGMSPQEQESMIKMDKTISNTEKAKARNQIRGG